MKTHLKELGMPSVSAGLQSEPSGVAFDPLYIIATLPSNNKPTLYKISRSFRFDGTWSFYSIGWYQHQGGFGINSSGHGFNLDWFNEHYADGILIDSWDADAIGWAMAQDNDKYLQKRGIVLSK